MLISHVSFARRGIVGLALSLVGFVAVTAFDSSVAADPVRRGLDYRGLRPATAQECGPRSFVLVGAARADACSHGPDPAPDGVDVTVERTAAELRAEAEEVAGTAGAAESVPCYGDGVSGRRVQAIYAVAADRTDRFAEVASLIRGYAAGVDRAFADSAAQTGGVRHVRWVTDGACALDVAHVVLSSTGDDNISATEAELAARGYNRTDRKYLTWVDDTTYCGIADVISDDRPTADNGNNAGPGYARIDTGCWGGLYSTEAHELMHLLGGVQHSAPHASGAWHCTDQQDRMCYSDGGGQPLTYPCPDVANEVLFDCGHDDYFHTTPPAGSYLSTHWNSANSGFLAVDASGSPPVSERTVTFTGTLSKRAPRKAFEVFTQPGVVRAELTFTKSTALQQTIRTAGGTTLAQTKGPSVLVTSA
ncbi:MAG TPA: hypothetical protein VNA14_12120, partial [Mycobacteriales bacterium]|nr:hypothetical protein [Mycobacteriales bacterium]